ncbi:IclR family transcriptional regulator [Tamaricihabitans halophyticus]|uniref:IclR family transcriptional regulator n=1 Tax=Tamaricihabitans halophyticus TaxID=1262583 RepID=A0A4R2Q9X1_9PSEU|nr:IclR family transcriptional regulator [Tamaricihabitans halophyticus]TCP45723.1 IclR family transcriptional regulator [Tamaricihabitans halophyticus]
MSESLRRGLRVLAALADEPATASRIAESHDISLSTAVRLLRLLADEGFALRDDAGRYHVGSQLLRVAYQVVAEMDVRQVAAPVLRALNAETNHTVHLGYFENPTLIYVDKYAGTAPVQMHSRIGQPAPLHCTAMGKAVAAYLPDDERAALVTELEFVASTPRTITNGAEYLHALDEVCATGYALNLGEHEEVVSAVAVPIRRPDGRVQYAIDVAVPNFLVDEQALRALIPRVVAAAAEIESALGYA